MSVTYTSEYIFPTSKLKEFLESIEVAFVNWSSNNVFQLPDGEIVGESEDEEDVQILEAGSHYWLGQYALRCGIDAAIREAAIVSSYPGLDNARVTDEEEEKEDYDEEEEEGYSAEDEDDEDDLDEEDDFENAAYQYGMAQARDSYDDDESDEDVEEPNDRSLVEIPFEVSLQIDVEWSRLGLQSAHSSLINIMEDSESLVAVMESITEDTAEYFTANSNGGAAAPGQREWGPPAAQDFVDDEGHPRIHRIVDRIRSPAKP